MLGSYIKYITKEKNMIIMFEDIDFSKNIETNNYNDNFSENTNSFKIIVLTNI